MYQHQGTVGESEGFRQSLLLRHPPGPVDPGAEKLLLKPRQIGGSVLGSRAGVAHDRIIKNQCRPRNGRAFPPVAGPGGKRLLATAIGGSGRLPRFGGWHLSRPPLPAPIGHLRMIPMTSDLLKRITVDPGKRSGKPCIRGLRITVSDILEYLASGMTEAEIVADFPDLSSDDIRACLAFAAERERRLLGSVA